MREGELSPDRINELVQYRRILNNIPAEIGVFDVEGRFLFNSPSGIRDPAVREWILGKTHHDWCRERHHPIGIADKRQAMIEHCVKEKETQTTEEVWTDKSGRRLHYVRTFSPIVDQFGQVTHVLGYGQEITELKKTEEELRQVLAEVETLKDRLREENVYLQEEIKTHHNSSEIVGSSGAIRSVLDAIGAVAPTDTNVVVTGETGTGKELVVRAVHALSRRSSKPLIKVNCAAIPRDLFESEFFGHTKGAFTGAVGDRTGRFPLADGGTLFLDEVGEIPIEMQSKLLRVLQEGEYERLGEARTNKIDVRVVAATNRNLKNEIEAGRFRQDLFYRLNVFPIEVPPLRHRREDIPLLAARYLERLCRKLNQPVWKLTTEEVRKLQAFDWPGNVRELENVLERTLITRRHRGLELTLEMGGPTADGSGRAGRTEGVEGITSVITDAAFLRFERENMLRALKQTDWRVYGADGAAKLLGIKPTTLASRMKKMRVTRR